VGWLGGEGCRLDGGGGVGYGAAASALSELNPPQTPIHKSTNLRNTNPKHARSIKPPDKPVVVPGVYRPQLKVHGFGLEGDAATEEVLLLALRERPASTESVMAGQRTQVGGVWRAAACLKDWWVNVYADA